MKMQLRLHSGAQNKKYNIATGAIKGVTGASAEIHIKTTPEST
jgi:ribosomal protein L21E